MPLKRGGFKSMAQLDCALSPLTKHEENGHGRSFSAIETRTFLLPTAVALFSCKNCEFSGY